MPRKAILIRCSEEEYELIHRAARAERRTISGFILNAVMGRFQAMARVRPERRPEPPTALPPDKVSTG